MQKLSLVAVFSLLLAACAQPGPKATIITAGGQHYLKVGTAAPNFTAQTLDGRQISLDSYRGKTLLVLFSTTWCSWCQKETPDVIRLYNKLHSNRVAFLRVDTQETQPVIRAFQIEYREPYTIALDPKDTVAHSGYDPDHVYPTSYVIDPNGIVRGAFLRAPEMENFILAAERGRTYRPALPASLRKRIAEFSHLKFSGSENQVMAQIKAARAMQNDVLIAVGTTIDDRESPILKPVQEKIQAEELAALVPVAHSVKAKKMVLTMQHDAKFSDYSKFTNKQIEQDSISFGKMLLAVDPSDSTGQSDLVSGLMGTGKKAEGLRDAIAFAKRYPSVSTYEILSSVYEQLKKPALEAKWTAKVLQLDERLANTNPTDANLGTLAEQAAISAETASRNGDLQKPKPFYDLELSTLARIKKRTPDQERMIQNAQSGELALQFAGKHHGTAVVLAPWTGAPLPGSIANTVKYRLIVVGKPNSSIQLAATHYANGWLPSFCTDNLCSPLKRQVTIPSEGAKMVEFQMIPNDPSAPKTSPVTVSAYGDGSTASASTTCSQNGTSA